MVDLDLEVVAFTIGPPISFPAGVWFQIPVFPVFLKLSKKKNLSIMEHRSNFPKSPQIIP